MNQKIIEEIENEILNMYKSFEKKLKQQEEQFEKISNFYEEKIENLDIQINQNYSIIKNNMDKSRNSEFIFNNINFKESEIITKENILKDNNNNIMFSVEPIKAKNKIIISKEREKCELFTAFNLGNNHPIIIWTIKQKPNIINIQWNNDENNEIKAHNNEINDLQYFHNENIEENNDYIISLSKKDEDTF